MTITSIAQDPTLIIKNAEIYVEATLLDHPYVLNDIVEMEAYDYKGNDISDRILFDATAVNYAEPNDYTVEVSVMDDEFNMTVSTFTVHVLTNREARALEKGHLPKRKQTYNYGREKHASRIDKLIMAGLAITVLIFLVYVWADMFW